MLRRTFAASLAGLACAATSPRPPLTWWERRRRSPTRLLKRGPAPAEWRPHAAPPPIREVRVPGPTGPLLAWYAAPPGVTNAPGLVYFHGHFSFAPSDFRRVRPFLDQGWAVMTPTLRGENGNPGDFELLRGEVDDAIAAIAWFAAQPEVDPARIHTLGHSVGGALSALLALVPDLPVVSTVSVGGIYEPGTFVRWKNSADNADLVRFDPARPDERELRVPGPHVRELRRPHLALVGLDDEPIRRNARPIAEQARLLDVPFTLAPVDGDHASSLDAAIASLRAGGFPGR